MKITQHIRTRLRLQGVLFALLFTGVVGMLAWLSTQYVYQADWTAGARNTVSDDTRRLLANLDAPVNITAYVGPDQLLRQQIRDLVSSYQRFKNDITLDFINPDTVPEQVRKLGITAAAPSSSATAAPVKTSRPWASSTSPTPCCACPTSRHAGSCLSPGTANAHRAAS